MPWPHAPGGDPAATLTVRDVPEAEKDALRVRTAKNGRSVEAQLRAVIHEAAGPDMAADEEGLTTAIRRRFAPCGAVDPPAHPPVTPREPPDPE